MECRGVTKKGTGLITPSPDRSGPVSTAGPTSKEYFKIGGKHSIYRVFTPQSADFERLSPVLATLLLTDSTIFEKQQHSTYLLTFPAQSSSHWTSAVVFLQFLCRYSTAKLILNNSEFVFAPLAISSRSFTFWSVRDACKFWPLVAILNSGTKKGSKLSFFAKDEFLNLRSSSECLR